MRGGGEVHVATRIHATYTYVTCISIHLLILHYEKPFWSVSASEGFFSIYPALVVINNTSSPIPQKSKGLHGARTSIRARLHTYTRRTNFILLTTSYRAGVRCFWRPLLLTAVAKVEHTKILLLLFGVGCPRGVFHFLPIFLFFGSTRVNCCHRGES